MNHTNKTRSDPHSDRGARPPGLLVVISAVLGLHLTPALAADGPAPEAMRSWHHTYNELGENLYLFRFHETAPSERDHLRLFYKVDPAAAHGHPFTVSANGAAPFRAMADAQGVL